MVFRADLASVFSTFWYKIGVCGNHLFSVSAAAKVSHRPQGIFGGFLRQPLRFVLGMSAYAYQEGRSVSSGQGGAAATARHGGRCRRCNWKAAQTPGANIDIAWMRGAWAVFTMRRQIGLAVPDTIVHHRAQHRQRRRSPALPIDERKIQMSTPWDKLSGDAYEAELRGDVEKAWELRHIAAVLEIGAERAAKVEARRAGSNAFRTDEQEAALREENQKSYNGDRGR
jgi:hypothetical protein